MALGHASPPPLVPFASVLLCAALGLAGMAAPAPVHAQAGEAAGALRRFDIPAGTLDQALSRYGRQAGVSISVNASLTAGLRSGGLSGSHTAAEALDLLLAGTGLQAEREGQGDEGDDEPRGQIGAGRTQGRFPLTPAWHQRGDRPCGASHDGAGSRRLFSGAPGLRIVLLRRHRHRASTTNNN